MSKIDFDKDREARMKILRDYFTKGETLPKGLTPFKLRPEDRLPPVKAPTKKRAT